MAEKTPKVAIERSASLLGTRIDGILRDEDERGRWSARDFLLDQAELKKWPERPLAELAELDEPGDCFFSIKSEKVDEKIIARIIRISRFGRTIDDHLKNVGDEAISWDYMLQLRTGRKPRIYSHVDRNTRNGASSRTGTLVKSDNRIPPVLTLQDLAFFDRCLTQARELAPAK